MKKQQLEQEKQQLEQALLKANESNRNLVSELNLLKDELNQAISKVKYLDGQVRMLEMQKQAKNIYIYGDEIKMYSSHDK
jgi:Zn-dependent oligopeptidase